VDRLKRAGEIFVEPPLRRQAGLGHARGISGVCAGVYQGYIRGI
jgi:hypothetical protein